MAYTKNTWATGDVVTAAKLNNIEDGIEEAAQSGGGLFRIQLTWDESSDLDLGYSYNDLIAIITSGQMIVLDVTISNGDSNRRQVQSLLKLGCDVSQGFTPWYYCQFDYNFEANSATAHLVRAGGEE